MLAAFVLHGLELHQFGEVDDLLWACNLACYAVGAGLIVRSAALVSGGTLVLIVGLPLWLLGTFTGARLMLTSVLVHVGGLVAGLAALRTLSVPRGIWWKTLALHCATIPLARACTTPARNVDLAFAIWPGFETIFPSWTTYIAAVIAGHAVAYALLEAALRRFTHLRPRTPCAR